jgi:flavodoxin
MEFRCLRQESEDQRPAIRNEIDIDSYDRIYIGYPMWWYTFPMIIYTFFDKYDFSGKTIIPFNTHMGSGDGGTYDTIRKLETAGRTIDTYPIIANEKYDADFDVMVDPARTDITEDRGFTFESELPDLEGYKDIYFGVPVWWGTYPQPVKSFLKQNGVNFSGKTVHFYNTHLGSRLGDMVKQMESLAPEAVIAADPFVLSADQDIREDDSAFREWIQDQ